MFLTATFFSVLYHLGDIYVIPHQLHNHDPHSLHLADPLPGHLEVHHDQVLFLGRDNVYPAEVQNSSDSWIL